MKFEQLFHELMNQYQACLYLFECISHGDSKYDHEIPKCCEIVDVSSALACRMESINPLTSLPIIYFVSSPPFHMC